ncbi:hypothetical protein [Rhodobacter sp. NSM]|uniref:hypothetical protein n=1 Tax=Rhodobacter sp. NSM TaxID=3457501 RepID=UPI003FD19B91
MRQPDDPLNPDTALKAATTARDPVRLPSAADGTIPARESCHPTGTRQEIGTMFHFIQNDDGDDLVRKHVEDNLRRTYGVSSDDEVMDDRFASLLRRIADKHSGSDRS